MERDHGERVFRSALCQGFRPCIFTVGHLTGSGGDGQLPKTAFIWTRRCWRKQVLRYYGLQILCCRYSSVLVYFHRNTGTFSSAVASVSWVLLMEMLADVFVQYISPAQCILVIRSQISMEFATASHSLESMIPNSFRDSLTCPVVPPSSGRFHYINTSLWCRFRLRFN